MGRGRGIHNFLYLFVGTFIGGGLVIDGRLHGGPHDNAGAVALHSAMSNFFFFFFFF